MPHHLVYILLNLGNKKMNKFPNYDEVHFKNKITCVVNFINGSLQ